MMSRLQHYVLLDSGLISSICHFPVCFMVNRIVHCKVNYILKEYEVTERQKPIIISSSPYGICGKSTLGLAAVCSDVSRCQTVRSRV